MNSIPGTEAPQDPCDRMERDGPRSLSLSSFRRRMICFHKVHLHSLTISVILGTQNAKLEEICFLEVGIWTKDRMDAKRK